MKEIIPSVLAKDEKELVLVAQKLKAYSGPLHIDIADGAFVQTTTVGLEEIMAAEGSHELDVHLMVQKPEDIIPLWLTVPKVRTIIFHVEATDKLDEIIETVHQAGKKVGVALNPETRPDAIVSVVAKLDLVHFMTVHPGVYGAEFQPAVVDKISMFHKAYPNAIISVDGSINPGDESEVIKAGASILIVGSYIVDSADPLQTIQDLNSKLEIN